MKALIAAALFLQLAAAAQIAQAADSSTESATPIAQPATVADTKLDRSLPDAPRPTIEEFAMASAAEMSGPSPKAISAAVPSSEVLAAIYIPNAQPMPPGFQNPAPERTIRHSQRLWWTLSIAQHSAATFDAWSTNRSIASGNHEANPLLKPFAGSAAIYGAIQAGPTAFDFLGRRMQRSQNRLVRRMWWVPQVVSTGASVFAGAHNLSISR
ncbi:MAG: hypothetical protein WBC04_01560 [Candidatus Acidiferrales bacterium]